MRVFLFILFALPAFAEVSVKPPKLKGMLNSEVNASSDLFLIWDDSAGLLKKIPASQLDTRWSGGEGGGGSVAWGSITGTLSNQTDLSSALGLKLNAASPTYSGTLTTPLTASRVLTTNASSQLAASSVTTTTLGYLDATSSIQTQLNSKQATGNYLTALTGDVTASGPGSAAATVAMVGSSTAANVSAAEVLANAATATNTNSAIVRRDGSGNFSAGTITASLSGNASTASALASNPSDCGAGEFASSIAANGNLTCSNPFTGMVESYTGHIETVEDKTYVLDEYASYGKQITNIRIKCGSGSVTAALQIGGVAITTCTGISVSTSAATTTCDTGSTNDLAANGRLTLVTTSNSSCEDLTFTVKTARD